MKALKESLLCIFLANLLAYLFSVHALLNMSELSRIINGKKFCSIRGSSDNLLYQGIDFITWPGRDIACTLTKGKR